MWPDTAALGLSLGDRACIALAQRLDFPVLTADQLWSRLNVPVPVRQIR
jgi:PIN domain nuclease of toxin-antitoxin system